MTKRPTFVWFYASLSLASAALLVPGVLPFATILTLGLIGLLPTAWLYASAMIPAFVLKAMRLPPIVWGATMALSLLAVAVTPSYLAGPIAERLVGELTEGDFEQPQEERPNAVELVIRTLGLSQRDKDLLIAAPCEKICQRLLLANPDLSVTIQGERSGGLDPAFVTYRLERRDDACPPAFADGHTALIETVRAGIFGMCMIPTLGERMERGLVIEENTLHRTAIPEFALAMIQEATRLTVTRRESDGKSIPLIQRTRVATGVAGVPFMVLTYASLQSSVRGWSIGHRRQTYNDYSLDELLRVKLGLDINPGVNKETVSVRLSASEIRTLLGKPGRDPFGPQIDKALGDWAAQYWRASNPPDRDAVALIGQILEDRRVVFVYALPTVLNTHENIISDLTDSILARLSSAEAELRPGINADLAVLVSTRLEPEQIKSRWGTISNILAKRPTGSASHLLVAGARIGQEGLPLIVEALQGQETRAVGLNAACTAHPSIRAALLPIVVEILAAPDTKHLRHKAILALASLGGVEAAETQLAMLPEKERDQLSRYLKKHIRSGDIDCDFGGLW